MVRHTGHPMVRHAREMVAEGALGPIRVVQVEYPQDWLATPLEETGQKQAEWRTDPARSGAAGSLGDVGTHAVNVAEFVTGLVCSEVAADLTTFVPGRRLEDNAHALLRFDAGRSPGGSRRTWHEMRETPERPYAPRPFRPDPASPASLPARGEVPHTGGEHANREQSDNKTQQSFDERPLVDIIRRSHPAISIRSSTREQNRSSTGDPKSL